DDNGGLSANQFGRQRRQPVHLILGPAVFYRHILAFGIAGVPDALAKSAQPAVVPVGRLAVQDADQRDCLLRACGNRHRRSRAAEQRYELASPHSITSSARPDKGSGTVMPSALAVFRFRKSSTLVDC